MRASRLRVDEGGFTALVGRVLPGEQLELVVDGATVWTFHAEPHRRTRGLPFSLVSMTWPAGLAERLNGRARFAVRRPRGRVLAGVEATVGSSTAPIDLRDDEGRPLVVNKWGELTARFDSADPRLGAAILQLAARLVEVLEADGQKVMITSGTLLGYVRAESLLPFDDDADLAVVVDSSESPADVAGLAYRLKHTLRTAGFDVILHSAAHLQVRVHDLDDGPRAYCDIFLGFFRGDVYCQPFHLRDVVPRTSLTPTIPVAVDGVVLPAPPVPSDWLRACYGPGWMTPDPGFVFRTPEATRARYENWFGTFDFGREYWETVAESSEAHTARSAAAHADAVLRLASELDARHVLDAGCGDGRVTGMMLGAHDTWAIDFAEPAVEHARTHLSGRAQVTRLNLADGRDLLDAQIFAASATSVISTHMVLHVLTGDTRRHMYALMRDALRHGGGVVATFATDHTEERFAFRDPATWHLPVDVLADELAESGLRIAALIDEAARVPGHERATATVSIALIDTTGERR